MERRFKNENKLLFNYTIRKNAHKESAGREAEKIGIERNRSVTYKNDREGVAINFEAVGKVVSKAVKSDRKTAFVDDNWADEIKAYNSKRKE